MKNKLVPLILSLVIAFGLWMYVIMVEQPESTKMYYDIPVILQNEDILELRGSNGLMIVSERPKVTLHLSGTRTYLNELNESNINVLANVSSIETAGPHQLTYSISYPGNIPSGAITRLSSEPSRITLEVENRLKEQIPVVLDYMGTSVPEGMIADKEGAQYDRYVEITGPESVVSQIKQAVIQVNLENQTQTITGDYIFTLCNAEGEPVDAQMITVIGEVETVHLTLEIHRLKEIPLKVIVEEGFGATEQNSSIGVAPQSILVSGSDTVLANLEYVEVGPLKLAELESKATKSFDIVLPAGVTNETGILQATVTVAFPNLRIANFKVENIKLVNVPEGMDPTLVTLVLDVKLRGPTAMIEKLTAADITAEVDLSGAKLGTDKYTVQLQFPDGIEGIGTMKTYTVTVTLEESATAPQEETA